MLRPPPSGPRRNWLAIIAGTILAIGAGLLVARAVSESPAAAPVETAAP